MSRHFRDRLGPRDDDDALDALLAGAWDDGAAAVAAVLDLQGGKVALTTALGRQEPSWPASGLSEVREEITTLLGTVTAELRRETGPAHSTVMANLHSARQFLIQLRSGLTGRSLTKDAARSLAASLDHTLEEAGRTLRHLPPGRGGAGDPETVDLAELLSGIRHQIPELARRIDRLFDEASDPAPPIPVPSP
jgi:hypothetical protein